MARQRPVSPFGTTDQQEVVVLVGLQGSGKSTLVRRYFAATHAHVSKDLMPHNRNKSRRQRQLIVEALQQGRSVVVDNTNTRRIDRAELIGLARQHGVRVICIFLDAPLADCLRRNDLREGKAKIPVVGILSAKKHLEPPNLEEGWDALYVALLDEQTDQFAIGQVTPPPPTPSDPTSR